GAGDRRGGGSPRRGPLSRRGRRPLPVRGVGRDGRAARHHRCRSSAAGALPARAASIRGRLRGGSWPGGDRTLRDELRATPPPHVAGGGDAPAPLRAPAARDTVRVWGTWVSRVRGRTRHPGRG